MSTPDFSLIIPLYNEEESVAALAAEVESALAGLDWECLWVDDGSRDGTAGCVRRLATAQPRHRLLRLARNCGQSAALLAGLDEARGRLLGTLDGDGQNDPADLPRMIALQRAGGADLVNGRRAVRRDSWLRRVSSRVANSWRNALTGESVADVGCAIRVFRRECARHLPPFKGMHRFLPTLIRLDGWSLVELEVAHRPRQRGVSKYGVGNRLWVGILDTFGVMWLKRRHAHYQLATEDAPDGPNS
ncbi:MAG: glycosyltransferase family 2 protein [Candidatus Delongbacteria bacterium]